ncbi:SDR family NAD(P)-dependent oxidoreductase [Bifidobacterium oedipodis]|uniref:SDR family oxidoreductase n=1 Tax=Bifidobacterium oedipodis TaxID=2675322 RepID=A0A7Y0HSJ0_9BIFI|nr:SDR family oxidoreductase [Bifidobacterium sp. DSM 109957]NMM95220.1 SDR family oxidoreductase [Bifidobacterium sp. DSM 109957]
MKLKSSVKKILTLLAKKEPVRVPVLSSAMLQRKRVLITGGTSGIGFSIAEAVLNAGGNVIITSRSLTRSEQACAKLVEETKCDESRVQAAVLDLSNVASISQQFASIRKNLEDPIDVLVNNAGQLNSACFGSVTEEQYDEILNTNLKGTYFLTQTVATYMRDNSIHGNILFVTSSSAYRPAMNPYHLSKWALRGLVEGLAKCLAPYDIVVNGVAPGPTATPMLVGKDNHSLTNLNSPIGRMSAPEEIGAIAVMLISDSCRSVIGETVRATGGSALITFDDVDYMMA